MRTKYSSNSELAHVWANESDFQYSPRKTANSMACEYGKLYSYSTCIGQIIDNNTVIYNTASYSNTTSKHQGFMHSATSHYSNKIYLEFPRRGLNSLSFYQKEFNDFVLSHNLNTANSLLVKASRSRKYAEGYRAQAFRIYDNLVKYAALFNLEYQAPDYSSLEAQAIEAEKKAKELEKIRRAERIKEQAEALENWRAGLDVRNNFELTALRIKEDQIETTKGAKIPLDHAVKFWSLIKSWHEKGAQYVKDHHSIKLGYYTVNSFKNDILTVGCHTIPYSEIQLIANQLKLS